MPNTVTSLAPCFLQVADLLGVGRQLGLEGEVPLLRRHRQLAERAVEGLLHGVLERAGVVRRQGVALGVGPFVHVEAVDVIAGDAPLLEEVDRPAVHAHRADRQDEGERPAGLAGQLDLAGDLVAHVGVEVVEGGAGDRLELRVPPRLGAASRPLGGRRAEAVDLRQVPAGGQKAFHHRAGKCRDQIHDCSVR